MSLFFAGRSKPKGAVAHADVASILADLEAVALERDRRAASQAFAAGVHAVKAYQQRRFALTYADLMVSPRYADVARFFLDELYGPRDFSERDAQLSRVVPGLVRLFPQQLVDSVGTLTELHALSERLDSEMGGLVAGDEIDARRYVRTWQLAGQPEVRARQIALTLEVGTALDGLTRKPGLRQSLRLMRGPARAAGLAALQSFLERGFDTFKAMNGAAEFLALVGLRERELAAKIFATDVDSNAAMAALAGRLP